MRALAKWMLLTVLVLGAPARAVDFALNVGVLEVILLPPAHGGFYPYVGGSFAVPMGHDFTFIGALSLEWSFDQMRGGLVVVATLDYLMSEHVGFDLNLAFIHDQPGLRFAESDFFLGAGPGVSFFIGKWSISPYLNFFGGLRTSSASIVPGLNVARTF
jgi:hypothetical protein